MTNEKLSQNVIDAAIADSFTHSHQSGLDWSSPSHNMAKQALKEALFLAQLSQCLYCRREIKDEPGHVEIDHILPKGQKGKAVRWTSNNKGDRRATAGYPSFTFAPHNLVLVCKRCNNKKGSYDPRKDRTIAADANYVLADAYYEWVHAYLHDYDDHIKFLKGLIYQAVNASPNGDAVITACKLDELAAVERKACERKIKREKTIVSAFLKLVQYYDQFEWDDLVSIVQGQFPNEPPTTVREAGEELRRIAARA
ncbi:HNH endonuclease [Rhizobium leguminosarum]|uniref:HNH endonuclease n=1 Tax=Rhizobium leguminosarum TaxID=384 RepID=UPI001C929B9E|nr:HNH endonuclease [Rhizobium leguminosarum]MBY2905737.1 HNH endonuclease [Rhizobium leguminosarum]